MKNKLELTRYYGEPHARTARDLSRILIVLNGVAIQEFTVCTGHDGETEERIAYVLWKRLVQALKLKDAPYPIAPAKITEFTHNYNVVKRIFHNKNHVELYLNEILIEKIETHNAESRGQQLFDQICKGLKQ